MERKLPNSNVDLNTYIKSLMHQKISSKAIKYYEICDPYILLVDEDKNVSVWSCRLFPIKLFEFWAGIEEKQLTRSNIMTDEKEIHNLHIEKE